MTEGAGQAPPLTGGALMLTSPANLLGGLERSVVAGCRKWPQRKALL